MNQNQSKLLVETFPLQSEHHGSRLDRVLTTLLSDFSRAQVQRWVSLGAVTLDGVVCTDNSYRLTTQARWVEVFVEKIVQSDWSPQSGEVQVVYEDEHLLVLDKPAGLVVHPGAGHVEGTLVNFLLHRCPQLETLPRAGLIHRLDKGTSGLLVVAKTLQTYASLVQAIQTRQIAREYRALVVGIPPVLGRIEKPIGRHPTLRTKMAICGRTGRPACTQFYLLESFSRHALLRVRLGTGRTHQIRVHLSYLGFPIVGDPTYLGPRRVKLRFMEEEIVWDYPALHAYQLALKHPTQDKECVWTCPLPEKFQESLGILRRGKLADEAGSGSRH